MRQKILSESKSTFQFGRVETWLLKVRVIKVLLLMRVVQSVFLEKNELDPVLPTIIRTALHALRRTRTYSSPSPFLPLSIFPLIEKVSG